MYNSKSRIFMKVKKTSSNAYDNFVAPLPIQMCSLGRIYNFIDTLYVLNMVIKIIKED